MNARTPADADHDLRPDGRACRSRAASRTAHGSRSRSCARSWAGLSPRAGAGALRFLWSAVAPSLERQRLVPARRAARPVSARELRPSFPQMFHPRRTQRRPCRPAAEARRQRRVWVQGWMHDRDGTATRLTLVAPEGGRAELLRRDLPPSAAATSRSLRRQARRRRASATGSCGFAELDGPSSRFERLAAGARDGHRGPSYRRPAGSCSGPGRGARRGPADACRSRSVREATS